MINNREDFLKYIENLKLERYNVGICIVENKYLYIDLIKELSNLEGIIQVNGVTEIAQNVVEDSDNLLGAYRQEILDSYINKVITDNNDKNHESVMIYEIDGFLSTRNENAVMNIFAYLGTKYYQIPVVILTFLREEVINSKYPGVRTRIIARKE